MRQKVTPGRPGAAMLSMAFQALCLVLLAAALTLYTTLLSAHGYRQALRASGHYAEAQQALLRQTEVLLQSTGLPPDIADVVFSTEAVKSYSEAVLLPGASAGQQALLTEFGLRLDTGIRTRLIGGEQALDERTIGGLVEELLSLFAQTARPPAAPAPNALRYATLGLIAASFLLLAILLSASRRLFAGENRGRSLFWRGLYLAALLLAGCAGLLHLLGGYLLVAAGMDMAFYARQWQNACLYMLAGSTLLLLTGMALRARAGRHPAPTADERGTLVV